MVDLLKAPSDMVKHLAALPDILLHPKSTFSRRFSDATPFSEAITFAGVMFFLSAAAYSALGLSSGLDASSAAYIGVGTILIWVFYAIFMHSFAYILGARRGVKCTIAVYLFVIGALQPVFVFILWALTLLVPGAVTYRTIHSLGGSGIAMELASGDFLSYEVAAIFRFVSGILILTYFAIGISKAHRISMARAIFVVTTSLLFFVCAYVVVYLVSAVFGLTPVLRASFG